MGMDYVFAGSASYPRFNNELEEIVKIFGGKTITNRKPKEQCDMIEYFMEEPLDYALPKGTPNVFIKWSNDPYSDLTSSETKDLFNFMKPEWNKVKNVSHQIADELESLVDYNMGWSIN